MVLYSELAAMFPHKSGGFPLYANEGWRKYTTIVGPMATFGYWIGWSVVLAFLGLFCGSIAQAAWFPSEPYGTNAFGGATIDDGYFSTGSVHIGLQHLIAIGIILAVWAFNVFGTRIGVAFNYLAGALLMIPLFCFMILPFLNGDFNSANLTWKLNDPGLAWGGWQTRPRVDLDHDLVGGGVDTCATFAPEYKDTVNDTRKALLSAAVFSLIVYTLLPIGLTGGVGAKTVEAYDYVGALNTLVGSDLTNFFVVVILFSFIISMNTATADGSRALYGISKDGMTIKQLGRLNRFNVPGHAMSLDTIINILFVLFVGNIFGILAASNIGYVLAHVFALSGYVLLRKDRPNWPRPIKLPAYWTWIAAILCARFRRLQHRRRRLVPDRGGWLREGRHRQDHRFRGTRRVVAPLPLQADRSGRRDAALARGPAHHARGCCSPRRGVRSGRVALTRGAPASAGAPRGFTRHRAPAAQGSNGTRRGAFAARARLGCEALSALGGVVPVSTRSCAAVTP